MWFQSYPTSRQCDTKLFWENKKEMRVPTQVMRDIKANNQKESGQEIQNKG